MIAVTYALGRGARAQDVHLHAFLADTLQGGGIAIVKGGLELCGSGLALTGSGPAIDAVERVFAGAEHADELRVRRSLELAGPWLSSAYRLYRYSPEKDRWLPS
jgi:hypothetical protein